MSELKEIINEYRLNVGGVEFWVPYPYKNLQLKQRREYASKEPTPPPFKGRGTPEEIKEYLLGELNNVNPALSRGEDYREFMSTISLGVECSGFTYYVLDEFLKINYDTELKYHLYKSGKHLLEIYDHSKLTPPAELDRKTVEEYPEWVNLAQIQADWGNKPRYVVNSTTFINDGSTVAVNNIENLQTADLIGMMGYNGIGHHVVVVEAAKDKIIYAHSEGRHGREDEYGGVEYGEIGIVDASKPIEEQDWEDSLVVSTHKFSSNATRRLKILADGANV